jgi:hypothetical protein
MGPLFVVGSVLMAIYGRPAPGAPQWVAYAGSAVFLFLGVALAGQAFGLSRVVKSVVPFVPISMATIATWIGFAPGERRCGGSISFLGIGGSGPADCKLDFAIAAILLWLFIVLVIWRHYLHKRP